MRFDDRFLEEIKSRVRLSDVIGRSVKLKRQGREYVGLSPFGNEKSPSFFVNDDKGFYHDFSSGKHGDLISFFQETERLTFMEAVERLAAEAGVPLPAPDPRAAEAEKVRQSLGDWMDLAAKWFEGELSRPAGQAARAYLDKRGLPQSEWARFGLGFAPPGRTALKDYLVAKGAKPGDLVEAGLLIAPEDGGAPYDRFRDRIIFPIADARGRIVSFGGRAMDPEARAKYLNGPETSLFSKGRLLYGLPEARKLLHAAETKAAKDPGVDPALVVVEGYMDVIACQRAGVAAVAPLGTALTEEQMEVLWRLHDEPTLSFDGDAAGQRAASRAMDRALPLLQPGRSFKFAMVEGGKDPDDVLRDQGAAALRAQMAQTTPFIDRLFKREQEAEAVDTPERRTGLKVRLRKLAAAIADKDLAQAYREDLLARYEAAFRIERPVWNVGGASAASQAGRTLSKLGWDKRHARTALEGATAQGRAAAAKLGELAKPLSAALVQAAMRDPSVLDDKIEVLSNQTLGDALLDQVAQALIAIRMEADDLNEDAVSRRLAQKGVDQTVLRRLRQSAERSYAPFLTADLADGRVRDLWRRAFDAVLALQAAERALAAAKADIERDQDSSVLMHLKTDRDRVRRLVDGGEWQSLTLQ